MTQQVTLTLPAATATTLRRAALDQARYARRRATRREEPFRRDLDLAQAQRLDEAAQTIEEQMTIATHTT